MTLPDLTELDAEGEVQFISSTILISEAVVLLRNPEALVVK
jgi:hypothetical protein